MAKAGFKKRRYYFTDKSIALDTVIAFILSGIALLIEISGVVFSVATKGKTPDIFATLYVCAIVLSIVGIIFARYGRKAQEGGVNSKRLSTFLAVLSLILPIAVIIYGAVG